MHFSQITAIWRRLDLPTPYLADAIVAGMKAAKNPASTTLSCPHNNHPDWRDRFTRKLRVAWRLAFRCVRETGQVPLITIERRAA